MEKIIGIILAAGCSERFGKDNKLLASLNGRPLILRTIDSMQSCDQIAIVVRPNDTALIDLLATLKSNPTLITVLNPDAHLGMGRSIACGIKACHAAQAWCILPGDMPYINSTTVAQIIARLRTNAQLVVPFFQGKHGHPVGFGRQFRSLLLALQGDQGGKSILASHLTELEKIDTQDAGILEDIDAPSQMIRLNTQ